MQERFFAPGMDAGIGVNLLTGEALVQAVTGTVVTPEAAGQTVTSRIVRVEDIESLHTSLGVDVSASGSYMGFSASAKVDFADSCGFNSHSIYLFVSVVVTNSLTRINAPSLIPEAFALLQNGKPDRFRQRFGDVYVAGIHTGGEYFAVYQITGTSETDKESLAIAVTACFNGLIASADLSVQVNKAKESTNSHLDMRVFTFQNGGADTTADQDPGQIMAKAHNFAPSLAGANARFAIPYSILPESYLTLNLPNDNANLIDIENQKEMLARNFKLRNQLELLINDIDYILFSTAQNYDEFEPFDMAALSAERTRLAADFDRITKEASNCMRDATSCHLATFEGLSQPLPRKRAGQKTFSATLDRDWRAGTANPALGISPGRPISIARGRMHRLDLPSLFRIKKLSALVVIGSDALAGFPDLTISLRRMPIDITDPKAMMETPGEGIVNPIRINIVPGQTEVGGFPLVDFSILDTKAFQYFIDAAFVWRNPGPETVVVPESFVTWKSFTVEFGAA
jgi:hypothetical protein